MLSHDVLQVKDLDGCKEQGTQHISGKVDKIVTIKSGTVVELEPVDVDGEYVIPALKPWAACDKLRATLSRYRDARRSMRVPASLAQPIRA